MCVAVGVFGQRGGARREDLCVLYKREARGSCRIYSERQKVKERIEGERNEGVES